MHAVFYKDYAAQDEEWAKDENLNANVHS